MLSYTVEELEGWNLRQDEQMQELDSRLNEISSGELCDIRSECAWLGRRVEELRDRIEKLEQQKEEAAP